MSVHILPFQWSKFADIDDVPPISSDDEKVLDEIRAVLVKHGKEQRFGVCLLHKHFDMAEGEALVEETDVENRKLVVRPMAKDQMPPVRPTLWAFDKEQTTLGCIEGFCLVERDPATGGQRHSGMKTPHQKDGMPF